MPPRGDSGTRKRRPPKLQATSERSYRPPPRPTATDKAATVWAGPRSVFIPPALRQPKKPPPSSVLLPHQKKAIQSLDDQYQVALGRPVRAKLHQQAANIADLVPHPLTTAEEFARETASRKALLGKKGPGSLPSAVRAAENVGRGIYHAPYGQIGRALGKADLAVSKTLFQAGLGTPGQQAAANEKILENVAGKSAANLVYHGDTAHPYAAALELGTMIPGLDAFAALRVGRTAWAGSTLGKLLEEGAVRREVAQAARGNRALTGLEEKKAAHAAIDAAAPTKAMARDAKLRADVHAHSATEQVDGQAAKRAVGADAYNQVRDTVAEASQVKLNLSRDLTPEQAAHNRRYLKGGDLYKPKQSLQRNQKVFRTVAGTPRIQVIGPITPPQWVRRVLAVVPDPVERATLARWYNEVAPTFVRFFGPDAEAILRGFTVSQANASPTSGLQATLRVFDKIRAGQEIGDREISAVVKSIEAAVKDEHVSAGMAAKLHDFADSIQGKKTRTWMGDHPDGGAPTANDIHALRDVGYVDSKLAARLRQPEPGALFSKGIDSFVVDSGGSPGVHQYERIREQYQAITDHLNQIAFDGRTDWEPREVQALGWSAIQRVHGAHPQNLLDAVANNTRRISLEVTKGASGIGKDLTLREATTVAHAVTGDIERLVEGLDNVYLEGGIKTGISGTKGVANASLHFEVTASPEKTHRIVERLADWYDRYDVQATRTSSSTGAKPTLTIAHADLADPDKMVALHQALYAVNKKRFAGFVSDELDGVPAITVVMTGKVVTKEAYAAASQEVEATVKDAVDSVLGDVEYNAHLSNTQIIKKGWKGGKGKLEGLAGAGPERAVHDPYKAEARQRLEAAVEKARGSRPSEAVGAQPEFRHTGFEPSVTPEQEAWARAHPYRQPLEETPVAYQRFNKLATQTSTIRARFIELSRQPMKTALEKEELARLDLQMRGVGNIPVVPRSAKQIADDVYDMTAGMASREGKQQVVQRGVRAQRIEEGEARYVEAGGGLAGHKAFMVAQRGELPTLGWRQGLREHEVDQLIRYVEDNNLHGGDRLKRGRIVDAFTRISEGRLPQPSQIALLKEIFGPEKVAKVEKEISGWQKIYEKAADVASLPRALKSSVDFSAPFRQGLFLMYAEPELWRKSWGSGFKAVWSAENEVKMMKELQLRPNWDRYRKGSLAIIDELKGNYEEAYAANLAHSIPIINNSQRGYVMFLNRLRADTFDHLFEEGIAIDPSLADNKEFLRSIGQAVNLLTGRGRLPGNEAAFRTVSGLLFSPRLMASRIEYLLQFGNPLTWAPGLGSPTKLVARRMIRRSMARQVGIAGMLLTLASFLPGVTVSHDPKNADFLKIRIGDFRLDILGGTGPYLVLASRLVSGEKTNSSTGETTKIRQYGHTPLLGTLVDFLKNKTAPVPSWIIAWDAGHTYDIKKFDPRTPSGAAYSAEMLLAPIGVSSGVRSGIKYGWPVGLADFAASGVGFGTQAYPDQPPKTRGGGGFGQGSRGGGFGQGGVSGGFGQP